VKLIETIAEYCRKQGMGVGATILTNVFLGLAGLHESNTVLDRLDVEDYVRSNGMPLASGEWVLPKRSYAKVANDYSKSGFIKSTADFMINNKICRLAKELEDAYAVPGQRSDTNIREHMTASQLWRFLQLVARNEIEGRVEDERYDALSHDCSSNTYRVPNTQVTLKMDPKLAVNCTAIAALAAPKKR
jgi:hypothetical protein